MTIGLVGQKCGMTRIFTEDGVSIPVTVIEAMPNRITQVKTSERDGYNAVQVTSGSKKPERVNKSMAGHFAAANVEAGNLNNEFRIEENDEVIFEVGSELKVDVFQEGQIVDVIGKSIGKGFAGTVKRHNFSMQDATHGNSISHRAPGSIGQNQTPGRVFPGKKMAGHMGNVKRTMQNLEVVKVDLDRNLILVKGAVAGHTGSRVVVQSAVKYKEQEIEIIRSLNAKKDAEVEVQGEKIQASNDIQMSDAAEISITAEASKSSAEEVSTSSDEVQNKDSSKDTEKE
jgi:large subunit ribosomal protein L3|tara:strand:- start:2426 stop:3283 length:858 start_codon:yes stop_codon:yes gene_type:complete